MKDPLQAIEKQAARRNFDAPPLHLWHPELSGDIPIRIAADGRWYHDGDLIERDSLVKLFASILRREEDGEYYLVTPAEKWRIEVELHPLIVIDIEAEEGTGLLRATLNTGKSLCIDAQHPLVLEPQRDEIPHVELEHGLSARLCRAAWYRLAELVEERDGVPCITSGTYCFSLENQA